MAENRGGSRTGAPGKAYANRTDLNAKRVPIATPRDQPYGAAKRSLDSQRAVPLATPTPPSAPTSPPGAPPTAGPSSSLPFNAPSARPDEPVTAGLPIGAGAGPESLFAPQADPTELQLRALYALFPNNDLLSLIEEFDRGTPY